MKNEFETCQDLSECWEVLTRPGWHAQSSSHHLKSCLSGLPKSDPDTSESSRLWCLSRSWVDKDDLKDVSSILFRFFRPYFCRVPEVHAFCRSRRLQEQTCEQVHSAPWTAQLQDLKKVWSFKRILSCNSFLQSVE